jgi:hypothetical protein
MSKALWQFGLDWLVDAIGGSTHWKDRERATRLARGMRMVGEHPEYRVVSAYISQLWRGWPQSASMVRECWRSVYRAKTSLGRKQGWYQTSLYVPDMLIEQHGLRPLTEERLAAVAHEALDAFLAAAQDHDTAGYVERRKELDAALTAISQLRYLRHGSDVFGFPDYNPEPARRPKWW